VPCTFCYAVAKDSVKGWPGSRVADSERSGEILYLVYMEVIFETRPSFVLCYDWWMNCLGNCGLCQSLFFSWWSQVLYVHSNIEVSSHSQAKARVMSCSEMDSKVVLGNTEARVRCLV